MVLSVESEFVTQLGWFDENSSLVHEEDLIGLVFVDRLFEIRKI